MNPGGDFGKKELSPALRNRFTEIYIPAVTNHDDLHQILSHILTDKFKFLADPTLKFFEWLISNRLLSGALSLRDYISWGSFVAKLGDEMGPWIAWVHGACLTMIDALGTGNSSFLGHAATIRQRCISQLLEQVVESERETVRSSAGIAERSSLNFGKFSDMSKWGIQPFTIKYNSDVVGHGDEAMPFNLAAPTTASNTFRILRAMQLDKPILLEGSPGVGKTSIVTTIAKITGHKLVRLNLSEQTDIMDLFGSDLPVEDSVGEFAWRDGPLLRALKDNSWVVLDELNLASQSVLEGLNACLDHRGEIYVPELDRSFKCEPGNFRLFACQNPVHQGGGRKGLPKSFLNRFTRVHVDTLKQEDLLQILQHNYPEIDSELLQKMVAFNNRVHQDVFVLHKYGQGCGDFNLRDVFRWCDLMYEYQQKGAWKPEVHVSVIYLARMIKKTDQQGLCAAFVEVFDRAVPLFCERARFSVTPTHVHVGHATLQRTPAAVSDYHETKLELVGELMPAMESLLTALAMKWMVMLRGPCCAGKTSAARLASRLSGNVLHEFSMNSSVDTLELLGGFEQVDVNRDRNELIRDASKYVHTCVQALMLHSNDAQSSVAAAVYSSWTNFVQKIRLNNPDEANVEVVDCTMLVHILERAEETTRGIQDSSSVSAALCKRAKDVESMGENGKTSGSFQWRDGMLIEALRSGDWLLIDNVNLCNASVLDRLNGLLEPNGSLILGERGVIDGSVPEIVPHPNFRLILILDPQNGDISRAMRNRGVEIQMDMLPMATGKTILETVGISQQSVASSLGGWHTFAIERLPLWQQKQLPIRVLKNFAVLIKELLDRGTTLEDAIQIAVEQEYQASADCAGEYFVNDVLQKTQSPLGVVLEAADNRVLKFYSLCLACHAYLSPRQFPSSFELRWMQTDSRFATVALEGAFVDHAVRLLRVVHMQSLRGTSDAQEFQPANAFYHSPADLGKNAFPWLEAEGAGIDVPVPPAELFARSRFHDFTAGAMHLLEAGVREFVEASSFEDWSLRKYWLEHALGLCDSEGVRALFSRAVEWIQLLFSHDDMIAVQNYSRTLSENLEMGHLNLDAYCWDYFTHRETHSQFEAACVASCHPAVTELWQQYVATIRSMRLQTRRLWRQLFEQTDDADEASIHTYSWLQQSQALERGRIDESRLCHPAVQFLGAFITGVDAFLDKVVGSNKQLFVGPSHQQVTHAASELLRQRNLFYDLCSDASTSSSSPGEETRIRYNWTISALDTLAQVSGCSTSAHLENIASHLTAALRGEKPDAQSAFDMGQHLWPCHTFRIQKVYELYSECLRVDRLLDTVGLSRRGSDYNTFTLGAAAMSSKPGPAARQQFCDAIATLFALDESISHDNDPLDDVSLSVLSGNHQNLLATLEGIPQDIQAVAESEDKAARTSELNVLSDYVIALEEASVLSKIVASCTFDKDGVGGVSARYAVDVEDIKKLVVHLQSPNSTRPPSDAASYQRLVWVLHSEASESQTAAVVTELLSVWYQRTWASTYDDVLHNNSRERRSRLDVEGVQALSGPVRREQCVVTSLVDSMIKFQHTKVADFPDKQAQWAELVKFLDTHSPALSAFSNSNCERAMLVSMTLSAVLTVAELQEESIKAEVGAVLSNWRREDGAAVSVLPASVADAVLKPLLSDAGHAIRPLVLEHLQPLLELLSTSEPTQRLLEMHDRGLCWIHLGQLSLALVTPSSFVDHAAANLLQLSDVRRQIWDVDTAAAFDTLQASLMFRHPGTEEASKETARGNLVSQAQALQKKVVLRPTPAQFDELQAEIVRCNLSLCSTDRIMEVARGLSASIQGTGGKTSIGFLQQQESLLQSNLRQFCDKLQGNFPLYRDIIRPIVVARNEIALGLRLLSFANEVGLKDQAAGQFVAAEQALAVIARLPQYSPDNQSPIDSASALVSPDTLAGLKAVMPVQWSGYLRGDVLDTALIRTRNYLFGAGHVTKESAHVLDTIFGKYVEWWDSLEAKRAEKEAADAAMFKFKEKVHTAFDDEAEAEREFKKMFPTYSDEFSDLLTIEEREEMQDPTVTSGGDNKPADGAVADEDGTLVNIHAETINFIASAHSIIWSSQLPVLGKLSRAAEPSKLNDGDRVEEAMVGFNAFGHAIETFFVDGSSQLDAEIAGTFRFVAQLQCAECDAAERGSNKEASDSPANKRTGNLGVAKPYDFYRDSNVAEVKVVLDVLVPLKARLEELLEEFFEHPNLVQLLTITDRILKFSVQAPIIKFLCGIDLILSRAQDWERVAKKSISLITHLESITRLIIRWRKLELKRWPSVLVSVEDKFSASIQRLWFNLYKILAGSPQYSDGIPVLQANAEYLSRIFDAIDSAFQRAKLGTFLPLLNLIRDFGNQAMAYADLGLSPPTVPSEHLENTDTAADTTTKQPTRSCSWCSKQIAMNADRPVIRDGKRRTTEVKRVGANDGFHTECGRCKQAWYCNVVCQKEHWKLGGHKEVCKAYKPGGGDAANAPAETGARAVSFRHSVANMVCNLHAYYSQFADKMASTLVRRRKPLEKELKDYVKIARWKDTNYSALKSSAEKTHRKIHAIGRKYEAVLTELITPILEQCLTPSTSNRDESQDTEDLQPVQYQYNYLREFDLKEDDDGDAGVTAGKTPAPHSSLQEPKQYLISEGAASAISLVDIIPDSLAALREHEGKQAFFCRLPGLLQNMQNTCFNRVLNTKSARDVSRIDNFSLNIMHNVEWLQTWADKQTAADKARAEAKAAGAAEDGDVAMDKGPKVIRWTDKRTNHREAWKQKVSTLRTDVEKDEDGEEDKVRDHHKHARMMKHKGFGELLKMLEKIGLRSRAVAVSERSFDQAIKLPLVHLDPVAAYMEQCSVFAPAAYSYQCHQRMDNVAQVWGKCEEYHFRILGRMTTLRQCAISPHAEVGQVNAQRCAGLAEHLLFVQLQQRRIMSEFLPDYSALLCLVNRATGVPRSTVVGAAVHVEPEEQALNVSAMKVAELRTELANRDLVTTGKKAVLQTRLTKALAAAAAVVEVAEVIETRAGDMIGATRSVSSAITQDTMPVLVDAIKWAVDSTLALLAETRLVCGQDLPGTGDAATKPIEDQAKVLKLAIDTVARDMAIRFGEEAPISSQHLKEKTIACCTDLEDMLEALAKWLVAERGDPIPAVCSRSVSTFIADARGRLQQVDALAGAGTDAAVDADAMQQGGDGEEMAEFTASYNSIMSLLLSKVVAIGKIKTETQANLILADKNKKVHEDTDEMHAKCLVLLHKELVDAFRALNLQSLNAKLQQLSKTVAGRIDSPGGGEAAELQAKLLQQLTPFLLQYLALCDRLVAEFSCLHRSICKLSLILSGLFADILKRGFCGPVDQSGEAGDEEGELDGTGMADGEGAKDVSEEIEDEEQVLGLQQDEPEKEDEDKDMPEEDNAIDMTNEFDGELYDVDEDEEEEDKSDDDFDEDELDQQMGETDFDKSETTEEQQLQDSDDDGKDLDDDGMEGGTRLVTHLDMNDVCALRCA